MQTKKSSTAERSQPQRDEATLQPAPGTGDSIYLCNSSGPQSTIKMHQKLRVENGKAMSEHGVVSKSPEDAPFRASLNRRTKTQRLCREVTRDPWPCPPHEQQGLGSQTQALTKIRREKGYSSSQQLVTAQRSPPWTALPGSGPGCLASSSHCQSLW